MIENMSDFPYPYKNVVCDQEELFKSMVEKLFKIKIKQTLFMKGANTQYHLYVWYESINDCFFDENGWENNKFIHSNIIKSYLECYNLLDACHSETYLHLSNYRNSLMSYSYGHAVTAIKKAIQGKYAKTEVLLDYSSNLFVVKSERSLIDKKDDIVRICYQLLKEYDNYNVINLQDVKVEIISENSDFNLNDIHMMNRKI